jgi:hypothetical protein
MALAQSGYGLRFFPPLPLIRRNDVAIPPRLTGRGRSSVGRAPEWHSGGQGFDSPRLHQAAFLRHCSSSFRSARGIALSMRVGGCGQRRFACLLRLGADHRAIAPNALPLGESRHGRPHGSCQGKQKLFGCHLGVNGEDACFGA